MNPYSNGSSAYRAEALVDYFNTITEFRFVVVTAALLADFSTLLWNLNRKVIIENRPKLSNIVLNEIQQNSDNDYRFFYISFHG
jgi:hypothetical protein